MDSTLHSRYATPPAMFRRLLGSSVSTLGRTPTATFAARQLPLKPVIAARFNSTSTTTTTTRPEPTEEEEIEAWLTAIKDLRARYETHGVPDFDSPQLAQLSQQKFEATPEQLAKVESLVSKPIPQKIDPVIQHCTNMIMKDGKKARAQRVMARALYIVRLELRQDPVQVLKETLDKMAPLMQLKTYKTRVAKNLTVPVPLNERQRNRRAFQWIVEGSEKRRSKDFAVRLAEEIIVSFQGKGAGYEKRAQMHKAAMLHRAYIKLR